MYEVETEDVYEDLSMDKEMFYFNIYSAKLNIMIIQTN